MKKFISQMHIEKNISLGDYKIIKEILEKNNLSRYKLKRKDLYVMKNSDKKIIACGRVFQIGEWALELGSIWVDQVYRGQKLWLSLCKELLQDKVGGENIYLATKRALGWYYKKIWFKIIDKNIPEKLLFTMKWAEGEWIECIIMKIKK